MKTANLTVRIEPALKRQAQEAARELDLSLSQVVTAALKGMVRASRSVSAWRGEWIGYEVVKGSELIGENFPVNTELERCRTEIRRLEKQRRDVGLDDDESRQLEILYRMQFDL